MNHRRRTTTKLGRLGVILAAGMIALMSVMGCGPATPVSSASPILTATLAPTNAVGPTVSAAVQSPTAAQTTVPTATQTSPFAAPAIGNVTAIASADLAYALGADGTFRGAAGVASRVDTSAWTLVSDLVAGEPPRSLDQHVIGSGDRTDLALPSPGQRQDLMINIQVAADGTVMLLDAH